MLPPILSLDQEEAADWPTPEEIVQGILYRGAKGMIAGPSKSRKTYILTDLAISVAAGVPWLGFPTTKCPVLYVNIELQSFAFRDRRRAIAQIKLTRQDGLPLWSWHLRGYGVSLTADPEDAARKVPHRRDRTHHHRPDLQAQPGDGRKRGGGCRAAPE
ncbi:MAG: AAA family ATPase [Verrucomicrobiales bacterium]|nr:AAA family ATPase [Verrucomicrobiales bacterium]